MSLLEATVTDTDLAELTGYDPRHVRRLAAEGVLPKAARNSYPLGASIKALLKYAADQGEGSAIQAAKLRKLEAEATLTELELAKASGAVASIADFERVQQSNATLVRVNMQALPRRVAHIIVGETSEARINEVLSKEIAQVLTNAYEQLQERTPDDFE